MECFEKKDAIILGLKRYFTGRPCRNGHVSERFTASSNCIICDSEKCKIYRSENHDTLMVKKSEYKKNNKSKISLSGKLYYTENKDSITNRVSKYKSENKHKVNALGAKRRASKLSATPLWLSKDQLKEIDNFYMIASWYSESYHVDHIVPLMGEMVCGLHVPWNLQVITAIENLSKGNGMI